MTKNKSPYDIDGIPAFREALPLGLQHILAMFVANITPIMIVGGALHLPAEEIAILIQASMLVAGLNTFIQTYRVGPVGARLPIVVGSNFTFVPLAITIGNNYGYEAVLGAALIGGIFEAVLGFFIQKVRRFFPSVVTGVIVLSIGLSLLPVGIASLAGGFGAADFGSFENLAIGCFVLIVIILFKQFAKGIWSTGAIFIGTMIGFVLTLLLGKVDLSTVAQAGYLNLPMPFRYGFIFKSDAILAMMLLFVVSAVETLGDMSSVTMGGANRELTDKELSGGIVADGIGASIASIFGILPTTSFSQNTGIITMTKVMSRYVVGMGAVILMIGAFFPKVGALLTVIPPSVIGGSLVMIFAMISISGINLLTKEKLTGRNAVIVAVSLGLGYGLGSVPDALTHFPESLKLLFGGSGIVISGGIAIILNILLPHDEKIFE